MTEWHQEVGAESANRITSAHATVEPDFEPCPEHQTTDGWGIRGELDWIVLKAMEKDRGRRYETASKFAEDVQHYLNDEAVVACPPSRAYRFRKFAQRNRATLATSGVVVISLLLGLIATSWQANVPSLRAIDLTTGAIQEILPFGDSPTVSPDLDPATEGYQGMVAFSAPDGSQVGRQGQDDIYLAPLTIDVDGRVLAIDPADVVNLTDAPYSHQVPHSWSPDGSRLLYLDTNDPLDDEDSLVAEDLETGAVIELARVPINNNFGDATWTTDGNSVVFELYGELMIVPSEGSTVPVNYSQTRNDSERQPAWNPNWDPSGDGGF